MRLPPTPWELGGFHITQLNEFQNFGRDKSQAAQAPAVRWSSGFSYVRWKPRNEQLA